MRFIVSVCEDNVMVSFQLAEIDFSFCLCRIMSCIVLSCSFFLFLTF